MTIALREGGEAVLDGCLASTAPASKGTTEGCLYGWFVELRAFSSALDPSGPRNFHLPVQFQEDPTAPL
jgi:hypothetical protein